MYKDILLYFDYKAPSQTYKTQPFLLLNENLKPCADFLELALQFGMIMMFACAFPLAFAFSAVVYNAFSGASPD